MIRDRARCVAHESMVACIRGQKQPDAVVRELKPREVVD